MSSEMSTMVIPFVIRCLFLFKHYYDETYSAKALYRRYTKVYSGIPYMSKTTIKIDKEIVLKLQKLKIHPRQSNEEVILKLLEDAS